MLTPDQALKIIFKYSRTTKPHQIDIRKACGQILASDVRSLDNLPRFDNSAMDGYAVRSQDVRSAGKNNPVSLKLLGEVHAGMTPSIKVRKGTTIRISTGAPLPKGADAVVMQEYCEKKVGFILVQDTEPRWGNVRRRGEEIRKGRVALQKGTLLNPGSIAWMNTMGIRKVSIFQPVKIGILRSGNEVVETVKAKPYQIRDAHGVSLVLALEQMGLKAKITPIAADTLSDVIRRWKSLLRTCDVIMTTGGVSVGDRDLFMQAAEKIGIKVLFHKISQKPGKPLAFGKFGSKLWFGLPGNPVSSLVSFYIYIQPVLKKMMGSASFKREWKNGKLIKHLKPDPAKTLFLRAGVSGENITLVAKQGSHCLGSFANANSILRVPPSSKPLAKGSSVLYTSI